MPPSPIISSYPSKRPSVLAKTCIAWAFHYHNPYPIRPGAVHGEQQWIMFPDPGEAGKGK